ncbi:AAA family ATPase [Halarcobacter sp.]|uniref:AAA family ATPase n=1 Tax=Halarcobacter sp. TaxID=2321133 RepID=UPI003A93CC89
MSVKTKFITICSGKGGVGKSFVAANLANVISKDASVLLWDSNLNFPNLHLIIGVDPIFRLNDYLNGNLKFEEIIFKVNNNFHLIIDSPLSDRENDDHSKKFVEIYEEIKELNKYDYVIIDTMPGADQVVLQSCIMSDLTLMLVTDEPTSIVDSYGLLKLINPFVDHTKIGILVNNVIDSEDYEEIKSKINKATVRFLDKEYSNFGYITYDREVRISIQNQELITNSNRESQITDNIIEISKELVNYLKPIMLEQ